MRVAAFYKDKGRSWIVGDEAEMEGVPGYHVDDADPATVTEIVLFDKHGAVLGDQAPSTHVASVEIHCSNGDVVHLTIAPGDGWLIRKA